MLFRSGGAGGASSVSGRDGLGIGGKGGGGNGAKNGTTAASGSTNTGGGGGGGHNTSGYTVGGNGGSGIVILKYPSAYTITIGAGLTGTTYTSGSDKYTKITAGTGNVSWA